MTSEAGLPPALPPGTIVVTMPKLSPSTRDACVVRWLKQPGDELEPYDLLMEVSTRSLTTEGFNTGKFSGELTLQVECGDNAHLVDVFAEAKEAHAEPKAIPVGDVIAVMCEEPDQAQRVRQIGRDALQRAVLGDDCVLMNWAAYLKETGT